MAIKIRLTYFGLLQHRHLPGASESCAPTPVGHTNRWHGFVDLVLPTDTRIQIQYKIQKLMQKPIQIPAWPSQRSRWMLIRCITSISLSSSYSSVLYRMQKSSPICTGSKILSGTFLSNTLKAAISFLNRVYASAP